MIKTAIEMTEDILISIGMKNAPEKILIEAYIQKCLDSAKKDGYDQAINEIKK